VGDPRGLRRTHVVAQSAVREGRNVPSIRVPSIRGQKVPSKGEGRRRQWRPPSIAWRMSNRQVQVWSVGEVAAKAAGSSLLGAVDRPIKTHLDLAPIQVVASEGEGSGSVLLRLKRHDAVATRAAVVAGLDLGRLDGIL